MRGGGVGFYVKNHINIQILDELSSFENKIMEALTIQATYPDNKSIILLLLLLFPRFFYSFLGFSNIKNGQTRAHGSLYVFRVGVNCILYYIYEKK